MKSRLGDEQADRLVTMNQVHLSNEGLRSKYEEKGSTHGEGKNLALRGTQHEETGFYWSGPGSPIARFGAQV